MTNVQPDSNPTLTTPWTKKVDSSCPWPEYPRPQMKRDDWQNLNGCWAYTLTSLDAPPPATFNDQILVPYPIESTLSGVQHPLQPDERLWYQRWFKVAPDWRSGRILLHFGAVDWECQVWINGEKVGKHQGGYNPFSFDITKEVKVGDNQIIVSVWDPTDQQPIQRGKQVLKPGFIWYTAISGIWQTVWLEHVPETYIASFKLLPDINQSTLTIETEIAHNKPGQMLTAVALDQDKVVAQQTTPADQPLIIKIPQPKLWSPESPFLYDLTLTLQTENGENDQIKSYFGMRQFHLGRDAQGHPRFCLNGKPLFLYGPLDQGYWPDGLYTPPTDEAMQWEINFLKKAGFNMLRKHIKVEPARYYLHCDQAGIIVWQDMISGGISPKPIWFFFANLMKNLNDSHLYWRLGRGRAENRRHFRHEYQEMIDALFNVVSIAIWAPFNEGWGQFDAAKAARWTKNYDPSRLVDHASGWFDQKAGDFRSEHIYFKPLPKPPVEKNRALVLSEFGGYSLNLPEHAWRPEKAFGYKKFPDRQTLTKGYLSLIENELIPWIRSGCSAAVYTQTTDVETEVNGFLTYDRKIEKMSLESIITAHKGLYEESPK